MNGEHAQEQVQIGGIGSYRWVICGLLFFATTVNYIDRQILSLIKPILDNELHWSNEQFGRANAVFQASYAVGGMLFGKIIDRIGTKIGYAASIAAWSLAAGAHALVGSVSGFYWARGALGLGEAGNFPSAIKAVALWFPKKERTFATTLFNSGANVGAMIAPAVVPWLAFTWGWHSAFIAAGAAGLLWLLLWIPLYDVPERSRRLSAAERDYIGKAPAGSSDKVRWLSLFRYRQTWSFILAKFLTDPVWWFFLIWLPDFFKKTRHLDVKNSWPHLVTIYGVVTLLSNWGGKIPGYLAERRNISIGRARKIVMFGCACCVVPIVFVTKASDWGAVFLIGFAAAAHQAWSANLFTSASDMFPQKALGSMVGLGGMAGSIGGMIFPIVSGKLLDHFEKTGSATAGYGILFAICASAYLIAFAVNHALAPRFDPIEVKDDEATRTGR